MLSGSPAFSPVVSIGGFIAELPSIVVETQRRSRDVIRSLALAPPKGSGLGCHAPITSGDKESAADE